MRGGALRLVASAVAVLAAGGCEVGRRPIAELTADAPSSLTYPGHRRLELRFRPTDFPLTGGCPTVFLHLEDGAGRVVRTFDHRPPRWMPGEEVSYGVELFQSALAPPLPAGGYRLVAGVYDPATGRRSRLRSEHSRAGDARYELAAIEVGEGSLAGVDLEFASGWHDPEPGSDAQILVRRWFSGAAELEVTAGEAVDLWLLMAVPRSAGADLVLDAGERRPRVTVTVSCAADPPPWGGGRHQLAIGIAAGERCEIGFGANFVQRFADRPRSAALEAISWRARSATGADRAKPLAAGRTGRPAVDRR